MTDRSAPEIRQIAITDFDTSVLPAEANIPDTEAFRVAVSAHFRNQYAARGWNAAVTVDAEFIRIVGLPQTGVEPKEYVLGLLQHGFLQDALPLLEILDGMFDDADIAYNRGICLGQLGHFEDSASVLKRCIRLDPNHTDARVALGVAHAGSGDHESAANHLRIALKQDPKNLFALQNLATVLRNLGRYLEALPLLQEAVKASPNEPLLQLGLAECLEPMGGLELEQAVQLYERIVQEHPDHPSADAARTALNRIGAKALHKQVAGQPRLDAVRYMRTALERFERMSRQQVGEIVMEIAQLGQSGLAIHAPEKRYTLERLPGDYSGLELVSMMHVGFRALDPNMDPETGLEREYQMALALGGSNTSAD